MMVFEIGDIVRIGKRVGMVSSILPMGNRPPRHRVWTRYWLDGTGWILHEELRDAEELTLVMRGGA